MEKFCGSGITADMARKYRNEVKKAEKTDALRDAIEHIDKAIFDACNRGCGSVTVELGDPQLFLFDYKSVLREDGKEDLKQSYTLNEFGKELFSRLWARGFNAVYGFTNNPSENMQNFSPKTPTNGLQSIYFYIDWY